MKLYTFLLLLGMSTGLYAQQTAFDIFKFNAPPGWTKGEEANVQINYTNVNQQTGAWCRFVIYKSTEGSGNLTSDFNKEWNDLVLPVHQVNETPLMADSAVQNGWSSISGTGKFLFDNKECTVMLRVYSLQHRCSGIIAVTNNMNDYEKTIQDFLSAVTLQEQAVFMPPAKQDNAVPGNNSSLPAAISTPFQFNTTNFDDGWTSVVKEDWVEVYKGDIRVLLHYPREEEKKYISQQDESTRFFWNLYVAPRYSNLRNFELLNYNMSFEPGHFACGLLTDNKTGQDVWVTLFSKAKSGWIEIITKDKQDFVKAFGISNPNTNFDEWEPLQKLATYNKFAVGENDITGKWSNDFTASNNYYNVYTGIYAGSSTYASRQTFVFNKDNTFNWEIFVSNFGTATRSGLDHGKSTGTFKLLNNWQIWFSEIERKSKTYNAYFTCIKGRRILWLQDISYGGYTSYGLVE